jgi:hypothetical protein
MFIARLSELSPNCRHHNHTVSTSTIRFSIIHGTQTSVSKMRTCITRMLVAWRHTQSWGIGRVCLYLIQSVTQYTAHYVQRSGRGTAANNYSPSSVSALPTNFRAYFMIFKLPRIRIHLYLHVSYVPIKQSFPNVWPANYCIEDSLVSLRANRRWYNLNRLSTKSNPFLIK